MKKLTAFFAVDLQNVIGVAEKLHERFNLCALIELAKTMYDLRRTTIFASEIFCRSLAVKRMLRWQKEHNGCTLEIVREVRMSEYDPVDGEIHRHLTTWLSDARIQAILLASSDGGFASVGTRANRMQRKKIFHVFPYTNPSKHLVRTATKLTEIRGSMPLHIRR